MKGIIIRKAGPDDLAVLEALERASFKKPAYGRKFLGETFLHDRLANVRKASSVLIAETKKDCAGYAVIDFDEGASGTVADIARIAVDKRHRGRGLGFALLEEAEKEISSVIGQRWAQVTAEIHTGNLASQFLFHGAGFRAAGRLKNYYKDGADALIVKKTLAPQTAPAPALSKKSKKYNYSK